ncbi:hypothetical protein Bca52824_030464 [Brassica carinata]|uniref:ADP-ribosyl cyclase/cyclic ADP-ribose hydrolase n=1 Tax=Brassica carinata TaxID=52824 RepID=A0A8X7S8N1_BRACI|nr:hypothetical protein Bca52824_030464 [Brassica carinata]
MASSGKPLSQPKVFINFPGDALSSQFVGHLKSSLESNLCIDVVKKSEIYAENVHRVKESKIALVIISSMYSNSSWCLDELVEITRRVEEGKLVAIPILYKLDASVVKELEGDFGYNLSKLTSEFDKLKIWKEALDFISQKLNLVLSEDSEEPEIINGIIKEIKRQLIQISTDQIQKKIPDQLSEQHKSALTEAAQHENYTRSKAPKTEEANSDAIPSIDESRRVDSAKEEKKYLQEDKRVPQHQVFINFQGEDVGFSFVSHLVSALLKKGINVFRDEDERSDEDIGQLDQNIEDSKIAIVVFSGRYSESTWCLDELVKIKERADEGKLEVIPISYKVEPSEVQQLNGDFGDKLWNLWRLYRNHHIIKWKEALETFGSNEAMMRFWLKENSSEGEFVASIVEEVNKILNKISTSCQRGNATEFPKGTEEKHVSFRNKELLFGIEKRMEQLEQKLEFDCNETRISGVVGMPGIGKTTLAMMLYEKWNCNFVRCVPLLGIRKKWKDYGPVWLRATLLQVLLGGDIPATNEETTLESLQTELLQTKVFVVLDDVSDKEQLELLLGDLKWIKNGSKIVITTCDRSLLERFAHDTYSVPKLDNQEAFQLFSYHALEDQNSSPSDTLITPCRISVDNAGGNPLALKLMGSKLREEDKSHLKHNLEGPAQSYYTEILDVWKSYIDQLNQQQRDVFLDIVYFFKSEDEYFVRSVLYLGVPGSIDALSEVTDLADKFLITISDNRVEMNDLVYQLGMQLGSPGRHKLWKYEDIINKLGQKDEIDTCNVRGIYLHMCELTNSISLEPNTFTNMHNLRYLKIYDSCCPRQYKADDCKLNFPYGLDFPLKEIRYLHWEKFPLEEIPSDFKTENLVDLRLPYSNIKRVWEGIKDTPRLKWVDLSHSRKLLDLTGLLKGENIQRLNLEGCTLLDELPLEIQNMKSLAFLNLRGCIRLWSLPKINLASLKTLILSDCSSLKEFQLISESIEFLHLDGTAIYKLPPSIKNMQRLVLLDLKNCKVLKCLPKSLSKLKDLEELILSGCSSLENILDVKHVMKHLLILRLDGTGAKEMPNLSSSTRFEVQISGSYYNPSDWPQGVNEVWSLERLSLSNNDFVSLPADVSKLCNLKSLDVKHCKKLKSLPMLPPKLQYFDAHGCGSLESVSNPLALQVLTEHYTNTTFNFSNCKKLDIDANESIISYTRRKGQLVLDALSRYNGIFASEVLICTCFPGWKVPAWFSHRASGSMLNPKLPPNWCDNKFTGIALCAVVLFSGNHDKRNHLLMKCNFEFQKNDGSLIRFSLPVGGWGEPGNTPKKIELSHVFVGYISRMDINKHGFASIEEGCIYSDVSLEFQVTDGEKEIVDCKVLNCGFSLFYASDERDEKAVVIPKSVENPEMISRLKQLEKVLYSTPGETRVIGVVGEPGIGKTTLAETLFKKRGCRFPINLFLRISKEHRPELLRRKFWEELLKQENETSSNKTTYESLKDKMLQTKSFIVIDGVGDKKQLEILLGDLNWIKNGSKILITTREVSFLEGFAHDTYVVPKSNSREAFQQSSPTETSSITNIQEVVKSSIDQLNEHQKDVFLDIVCFFRSDDEYFVRSLLVSENLDSVGLISEVRELVNRNLIEISDGRVETNDQGYTFAKKLGSPGRYTLLNYEDIIEKLKNLGKVEVNNARGVFIDMSQVTKRIVLEPMTFSKMRKLRYLKIYDSSYPQQCNVDCKLFFPDGLRFPLDEVRYLDWLKFPLRELPSDFRPENLVDLRLPYSMITRVWEGFKETPRLRSVDLSHSSKLDNISALSNAENLERLNLEGCTLLDELPPEIQNMKSLIFLNLRGCTRLRSLPEINLKSLKTLILSGCSSIKEFQLISERLENLLLDGTSIRELPPTINKLRRLVLLNMRNCKMLEFLPYSLCELKFLEELILSGCSMLKKFPNTKHSMNHLQILLFNETGAKEMPEVGCLTRAGGQPLQPSKSFCSLSLLQRLCLSGNGFVSLQADICQLHNLIWLDIKNCKRLKSVPMLPPRLQHFDAQGCDSLERVANPLALPVVTEHVHATFNFTNCNKLDPDAKDSIISYTRQKSQLMLDSLSRHHGCISLNGFFGTCFPGWDVPTWFSHRVSGSMLESTLPPHWFNNRFTGIALCAVIQFPGFSDHSDISVNCNCVFRNENGIRIPFSYTIGGWRESSNAPLKIESSHVFIGYVRRLDINKQVEGCEFNETSLEFQVTDGTGEVLVGCEVLKCGFNLVYAPDQRDSICWDAKIAASKELGKYQNDTDLQYQSCGGLRRKGKYHVRTEDPRYQSCHNPNPNPNPERAKDILGKGIHFENTENHDIKYQTSSSLMKSIFNYLTNNPRLMLAFCLSSNLCLALSYIVLYFCSVLILLLIVVGVIVYDMMS